MPEKPLTLGIAVLTIIMRKQNNLRHKAFDDDAYFPLCRMERGVAEVELGDAGHITLLRLRNQKKIELPQIAPNIKSSSGHWCEAIRHGMKINVATP